MKRTGLRSQQGFSLAELMVTIVVVGIVFTSIANLFLTIQKGQRETSFLETATRAAQREIEVLRNNQFNQLEPGEDIDFSADLPDYLPKPRTGTVEVSEPTSGLRRVDVTVTYREAGTTRTVKLSSLIGVIGITQ